MCLSPATPMAAGTEALAVLVAGLMMTGASGGVEGGEVWQGRMEGHDAAENLTGSGEELRGRLDCSSVGIVSFSSPSSLVRFK